MMALHFLMTIALAAEGIDAPVTAVSRGPSLIDPVTQRWQFGVVVTARAGVFRHMVATFPVPADWPEQGVRVISQETLKVRRLSRHALPGGSSQMVAELEPLKPREQARVIMVFELVRSTVASPKDSRVYVLPRALPAELGSYLRPSPQIECDRPEIAAAAAGLVKDERSAWENVESIYRWVVEHVAYRGGRARGARAALRSGRGKWEDRASLFIALCRANGIPARLVWVPGDCYAEFCLEDDRGDYHWFPCDLGEVPQLGGVLHKKPILQKGDRFQVFGGRHEQRYINERLVGCSLVGRDRPKFEAIRRVVNTTSDVPRRR